MGLKSSRSLGIEFCDSKFVVVGSLHLSFNYLSNFLKHKEKVIKNLKL